MSHERSDPAWVLITGASGGFGRLFAEQLALRGYALLLHGRRRDRLEQLAASLPAGIPTRVVLADLASDAGVETLAREAAALPLAGLVNNAGFGLWGAFERLDPDAQCAVLDADLRAPVALTARLLPQLLERRRRGETPFIINVSSLAGEAPLPYMSTYSAAKAGLTAWSEAIREELRGRMRVVTLAPGPSPTGFRDVSGMPESGHGAFFRAPSETVIRAALAALDAGGGFVVPGFRHRLLHPLQRLVPRPLALRLLAANLRPR